MTKESCNDLNIQTNCTPFKKLTLGAGVNVSKFFKTPKDETVFFVFLYLKYLKKYNEEAYKMLIAKIF